MADLKPLLPSRIPQGALGYIGAPPSLADLSGMNAPPPGASGGALGRIGAPASPNVQPLKPLLSTGGPAVQRSIDNLLPDVGPAPNLSAGPQMSRPNPLGTIDPPSLPNVSAVDPYTARTADLYADIYRREHPAKPTTALGKFGHIAANIGNVLGDIFAPSTMALIPGTQFHNDLIVGRDKADLNQQSQLQTEAAQRAQYGAKADDMTPFVMSREQATALNQPDLAGTTTTMRDYSRALVGAGHDTTSTSNNTRTNDTRQSISDDKLEEQATAAANKPENRDDRYISILAKPTAERTPNDLAYKKAYEGYINAKITQPGVTKAITYGQNRPVQVVNSTTQQVNYDTAGHAIQTGAATPGSNDYKAQGAVLTDFTSGNDAKTLTAFNTAIGHLHQLGAAGDALQNSDVKLLNSIANSYHSSTGASAPAVFQGVKTAVSGEIAKAFTGAGATVDEINEIRKSISDANSPEQLHSVVNSYTHLLETKRDALRDQFNAARKAQPNFGNNHPAGGGGAGTVQMRAPDGTIQAVDPSQVQHYQKRGAQVVR